VTAQAFSARDAVVIPTLDLKAVHSCEHSHHTSCDSAQDTASSLTYRVSLRPTTSPLRTANDPTAIPTTYR